MRAMMMVGAAMAALVLAACGDGSNPTTTRPDGYWESCTTDSDCSTELRCLEVSSGNADAGTQSVCSLECTTADDCYTLTCDQTPSHDPCVEGVCGRTGCL